MSIEKVSLEKLDKIYSTVATEDEFKFTASVRDLKDGWLKHLVNSRFVDHLQLYSDGKRVAILGKEQVLDCRQFKDLLRRVLRSGLVTNVNTGEIEVW